jgi:predicted AAA+ superfamily ATPase
MRRIYESIILEQLQTDPQMVFMSGPRQVGKTTIKEHIEQTLPYFHSFNWDNVEDRTQLLKGNTGILETLPHHMALGEKNLITFDEIHKYKRWKTLLKGFFDTYKNDYKILVTGSSRLNIFRKSSDSLMGRYFLYHIHPLSLGELANNQATTELYSMPRKISDDVWRALFHFGGFPDPLLKQEQRFYNRWQNLRQEQLFKEDIRELAQIHELSQLEVLAELLKHQTGQLTNYSNLAKKVRVSDPTIRRWITTLENFYYCFTVKPWSRNVTRSLIKEPKIYLYDWSTIADKGARIENLVACHLLKAVHFWTDVGLGKFELYFLRDKEQHEVDFIIVKDTKPWLMIEVKSSFKEPLSKNLAFFQKQLQAPHVLQLAFDLPYVEEDCFSFQETKIVSMQSFLSQLI